MAWGDPNKIIWNIPDDAKVVSKADEWEIYHLPSGKALYIYPTEYHTASMMLKLEDLRRLLKMLETGAGAAKPGEVTPGLVSDGSSGLAV